ncbi:MAG: hypothetical protein ACREA2_25185 [Blastocatellia bacterium]
MSTSRVLRIMGAFLLLMSVGQAAFARHEARRWVFLGQTTVDGFRDYDRITIGRDEGRFESIQLRVAGAPVEFQRVVVRYANGASEEVEFRDYIPAGGQTRAIDLRGHHGRAISSVDFIYSRARWRSGARPRVSLFGEKFDPRPGPWVFLGQTTVDGFRDYDRITVGRDEGRFQSIQLRVAGAPVEFQRVVVRYANGASEEVEFRDYIPAGGYTRAIDLRGYERTINSVDFIYSKARWRHGMRPRVTLYGR